MRFKGFEYKKCFYCGSGDVQKYGKIKGKQRYKCNACAKQFLGGERLNNAQLWGEYAYGKQTLSELDLRYKCSPKTIQRRLKSYQVTLSLPTPTSVVLLIDTTYWKQDFGVMLFKDARSGDNLLKYIVKSETNTFVFKRNLSAFTARLRDSGSGL